ncbi:MAG: CRISPR-associated protein [Paludibacteraceae bacterium]|nr:CRISPR-associated protein [Paludibacteraceae bacterium]
MKTTKYQYRFLARIVIEAKTPLAVGSGDNNVLTDALVATDANGLPYISGTSIAGVVRSMIGDEQLVNKVFGFQKKKDGEGSKIIFTEAKLLNENSEVIDGLHILDDKKDEFLKEYHNLPIRQHTKINHRGTTADRAKFDEQVVYAGSRFCFEMEMVAENDAENKTNFEKALEQIFKSSFRIGGGTRSGFGEIDVVEIKESILNLAEPKQLQLYLEKSSNLQDSAKWTGWQENKKETIDDKQWTEYILNLKADDFLMFGSGFGDEDVDAVPVKEKRVKWTNGKGEIKEEVVLIPGTSVKGAIAHRTAFYYNKLNNRFAGEQGDNEPKVGTQNEAVVTLFGKEGESTTDQKRGNVIISDVFANKALQEKIFDHVAIDRFTGGAVDGALFNEKAIYAKDETFTIRILVKKSVLDDKDKNIKEAFENALRDICKGLLPLGGAVNKGYGMFSGTITCEGKTLNLEEVKQ